ncbi:MAG TPA: hypothetical protein VGN34_20355 [Ktedonobacteraceae bacterium]
MSPELTIVEHWRSPLERFFQAVIDYCSRFAPIAHSSDLAQI